MQGHSSGLRGGVPEVEWEFSGGPAARCQGKRRGGRHLSVVCHFKHELPVAVPVLGVVSSPRGAFPKESLCLGQEFIPVLNVPHA